MRTILEVNYGLLDIELNGISIEEFGKQLNNFLNQNYNGGYFTGKIEGVYIEPLNKVYSKINNKD